MCIHGYVFVKFAKSRYFNYSWSRLLSCYLGLPSLTLLVSGDIGVAPGILGTPFVGKSSWGNI